MDHDALFKELISTLFLDFIDLFFPEISSHIDRDFKIVRLNPEIITDITNRSKHIVDLVHRVKVLGEDAFFAIHIENQASRKADFSRRMFNYFSRLIQEYDLPVYPIVIFSYDQPYNKDSNLYRIDFPGLNALRFEYKVVQLNRLSWRNFVNKENPVACALMAKMRIAERDRPRVKLECLRMLAKLQLDPARSTLIGTFVESYLQLSSAETTRFEREFAKLDESEKERAMELMTSWERKGREEGLSQGLHDGKQQLIMRQINRRLGSTSPSLISRVNQLTAAQLDDLGEALLGFNNTADLDRWLSAH